MSELNITVTMETRTCRPCAAVYAVPRWALSVPCPFCASRQIRQLEKEVQALFDKCWIWKATAKRHLNRAHRAEAKLKSPIKVEANNHCYHCGEWLCDAEEITLRNGHIYHNECLPENLIRAR